MYQSIGHEIYEYTYCSIHTMVHTYKLMPDPIIYMLHILHHFSIHRVLHPISIHQFLHPISVSCFLCVLRLKLLIGICLFRCASCSLAAPVRVASYSGLWEDQLLCLRPWCVLLTRRHPPPGPSHPYRHLERQLSVDGTTYRYYDLAALGDPRYGESPTGGTAMVSPVTWTEKKVCFERINLIGKQTEVMTRGTDVNGWNQVLEPAFTWVTRVITSICFSYRIYPFKTCVLFCPYNWDIQHRSAVTGRGAHGTGRPRPGSGVPAKMLFGHHCGPTNVHLW